MFWVLIIIGLVIGIVGGIYTYWTCSETDIKVFHRPISVFIAFIGIVIIFSSFFVTAQGELFRKQIFAGAKKGYWLVTDDSGGKVMRHWILENGYVQGCSQTDGWKFFDAVGNLHYVSGDSHVAQLVNDSLYVVEFKKTFKKDYNIPEDQLTLK
jgi:hypothetical protein